jgi:hypothetical protein
MTYMAGSPIPDLHLPRPTPLRHQGQVRLIILGAEEGLLPSIPPLRDMVGNPWRHHPCDACHGTYIALAANGRIQYGVPGITACCPHCQGGTLLLVQVIRPHRSRSP